MTRWCTPSCRNRAAVALTGSRASVRSRRSTSGCSWISLSRIEDGIVAILAQEGRDATGGGVDVTHDGPPRCALPRRRRPPGTGVLRAARSGDESLPRRQCGPLQELPRANRFNRVRADRQDGLEPDDLPTYASQGQPAAFSLARV